MLRKERLKIGFFADTYTPQVNGVVTSIETFRKDLEKLGHIVYIFAPTPKQKNDTERIIRFPSVKFIFQPEMRVALPYSFEAIKILDKIKLDIIHSHDPFSIGLFGLWYAKRKKIPYIHTYHTLYPEYVHYIWETKFTKQLAKNLSKDFCNQCDLVVAPSIKIKIFLKKWGVRKPIKIIPTGVELEDFQQNNQGVIEFKKGYEIHPKDKVLIFVGRLGKEKNIELLIKMLKKVKGSNIKLLIIGNGPNRENLSRLAKKEKVETKVIFLGYLPKKEVIAAYKTSNVFVFPSKTETQGLVIAEAMATGLPIVAVNDLATADMIKNGKNGFLVKSDTKEFACKIDKLLSDENLYQKMTKNSRFLAKELSAKKQAEKLVEVYYKLIKKLN